MARYGLLFDARYCVGCMACTVACKQEHSYDAETWGIQVSELIYTKPDGKVQVEFAPYPTDLCTMCAARLAGAEDDRPACVRCCMTQCITYGTLGELALQMEDQPRAILYAGK